MPRFQQKLQACAERNSSLLCIGLDPDLGSLPNGFKRDASGVVEFNRVVVEATQDLVCAYKPNLAFYEALGSAGLRALEQTLRLIPPHVPTIGDAKRGDVPNTARLYAQALFGTWGFDSATVNPYLGLDSLEPFLEWEGKGVWVLCRNSNPGAADLQDLPAGRETAPLYARVVAMVRDASARADKGLVVGATSARELGAVRELAPEMPLLVLGVGAQGGDAREAMRASDTGPAVISVSRSVLYGDDESDPAWAIRRRAEKMRLHLNALLAGPLIGRFEI
jgi:orotidine-5'-phosphate decarboxylase